MDVIVVNYCWFGYLIGFVGLLCALGLTICCGLFACVLGGFDLLHLCLFLCICCFTFWVLF